MQTLAWILLLAGGLLIRQVSTGRAGNVLEDFSDGFTAFVSGDWGALSEVSARRGSNNEVVSVLPAGSADAVGGSPVPAGTAGGGGTALIAEMRKLGSAANNRYVFGATGPQAYDCSGLVWRAMRNTGIYNGARFTTATFPFMAGQVVTQAPSGNVGDVVLWRRGATGHMGVVIGPDRMFSALSSQWGIRESTISAEKGTPSYWRIK